MAGVVQPLRGAARLLRSHGSPRLPRGRSALPAPGAGPRAARRLSGAVPDGGPPFLEVDGRRLTFDPAARPTILEVCEAHGVTSIQHDCRRGECGVCRATCRVEDESHSVLACREPAAPGLRIETQPRSACSLLKDPQETARRVAEALEHKLRDLPGRPAALSRDPGGVVRSTCDSLLEKCGERLLRKLLDAEPHLHLDKKALDDLELLVVARMARFHVGPALKFLNLNGNAGGDRGAAFVAEHVVRHCPLRSLFLSGNSITDEGVASVAEQMRGNASVQILELRANRITDAGAEVLADAVVQHSQALTSLYLSGNRISDAGAVRLATALPPDSRCRIWLLDNPISAAAKEALQEVVGKRVRC